MKKDERLELSQGSGASALGWLSLGLALGSVSTYLLDPDRGRRRRALLKDQWVHFDKVSTRYLNSKSHHVENVLKGFQAKALKLSSHVQEQWKNERENQI